MSNNQKRIPIRCWNQAECGREYTQLVTFANQPLSLIHIWLVLVFFRHIRYTSQATANPVHVTSSEGRLTGHIIA